MNPFFFLKDLQKKIILSWSAKAGCTVVAKLFFRHAGVLDEAMAYAPWVHDYREEVYQKKHVVVVDDLLNPDYLLLKIVRNPFLRAVSSYIHACKYPSILDKPVICSLNGKIGSKSEGLTFSMFVQYLELVNITSCNLHYSRQKQKWEDGLRAPQIIYLENIESDIQQVNQRYRTQFSLEGLLHSPHHVEKDPGVNVPAYDIPWDELHKAIPEYRWFYNQDLLVRVADIYKEDVNAYGYCSGSIEEALNVTSQN
jgi:hypothetical protein